MHHCPNAKTSESELLEENVGEDIPDLRLAKIS